MNFSQQRATHFSSELSKSLRRNESTQSLKHLSTSPLYIFKLSRSCILSIASSNARRCSSCKSPMPCITFAMLLGHLTALMIKADAFKIQEKYGATSFQTKLYKTQQSRGAVLVLTTPVAKRRASRVCEAGMSETRTNFR